MSKKDNKKTVFRRIGGRVVPITIGTGLVVSNNPFKKTILDGKRKTTVFTNPITKTKTFRTGGIFSRSKAVVTKRKFLSKNKISVLNEIFSSRRGQGITLGRSIFADLKRSGEKSIKSGIVSKEGLNFTKRAETSFQKFSRKTRRQGNISFKQAERIIRGGNKKSFVIATSKIGKVPKLQFKSSSKLIFASGLALLGHGIFKKDQR